MSPTRSTKKPPVMYQRTYFPLLRDCRPLEPHEADERRAEIASLYARAHDDPPRSLYELAEVFGRGMATPRRVDDGDRTALLYRGGCAALLSEAVVAWGLDTVPFLAAMDRAQIDEASRGPRGGEGS